MYTSEGWGDTSSSLRQSGRKATVATVRAKGLDWSQVEARSNLIAAAPELLAALKALRCHLCNWFMDESKSADSVDCPHCRVTRAAIAKAEGRSDGR
jgi:phage FluMu protein Com